VSEVRQHLQSLFLIFGEFSMLDFGFSLADSDTLNLKNLSQPHIASLIDGLWVRCLVQNKHDPTDVYSSSNSQHCLAASSHDCRNMPTDIEMAVRQLEDTEYQKSMAVCDLEQLLSLFAAIPHLSRLYLGAHGSTAAVISRITELFCQKFGVVLSDFTISVEPKALGATSHCLMQHKELALTTLELSPFATDSDDDYKLCAEVLDNLEAFLHWTHSLYGR
jgi:hypothetical protein